MQLPSPAWKVSSGPSRNVKVFAVSSVVATRPLLAGYRGGGGMALRTRNQWNSRRRAQRNVNVQHGDSSPGDRFGDESGRREYRMQREGSEGIWRGWSREPRTKGQTVGVRLKIEAVVWMCAELTMHCRPWLRWVGGFGCGMATRGEAPGFISRFLWGGHKGARGGLLGRFQPPRSMRGGFCCAAGRPKYGELGRCWSL